MKFLQASLVSLVAVFSPIKAVLLVTGYLIIADLISGVMAAKKRGETITSSGLRRTIAKFLVYNLAILTAFLVENYLVSNIFPITKIVSSTIGVTESLSIFENLNTINGGNVFKKVLDILGSKNGDSHEPPKSN